MLRADHQEKDVTSIVLAHGERHGSLTVLRKMPSGKYRCGCACGFSNVMARANALMKGRVKCCRKCKQSACKDSSSNKERT